MTAVSCEPVVVRPRPRRVEGPVREVPGRVVGDGVRSRRVPRRHLALRRGAVAAGCAGTKGSAACRADGWLVELQAVVFAVLLLVGLVIVVPQLLAMAGPDPALDPVPGDPAWAHVTEK